MCARQGRQGESGRSLASRVTRGVERVSSPHTHRPDDGTSRNDVLEYCK